METYHGTCKQLNFSNFAQFAEINKDIDELLDSGKRKLSNTLVLKFLRKKEEI